MTIRTTSPWWQSAIAGAPQPIRDGQPMEGYFATKAGRGGALIPARIWSEAGRFYCTIGGEARDAVKEWPYLARRPISAEAYELMMRNLKDNFAGPKEARKARLHELPPVFGGKR